MTLYQDAHPSPGAVNSAGKMIFIFEIPFLAVMVLIMVPIISYMTWRAHKKSTLTQNVALSAG